MTNLDEIRTEITISVPEAGSLMNLSERQSYRAAQRFLETNGAEGLPVIKVGSNRLLVPVARLLRLLGLDDEVRS